MSTATEPWEDQREEKQWDGAAWDFKPAEGSVSLLKAAAEEKSNNKFSSLVIRTQNDFKAFKGHTWFYLALYLDFILTISD